MDNAHQLCTLVKCLEVSIQIQSTVIQYGGHTNNRPSLFGHQLPRHDIGMVFELCKQDFIARFQVVQAPAISDEVDALGGPADKNNFLGLLSVEKILHRCPTLIIQIGGVLRDRKSTRLNSSHVAI